MSSIAAVNSSFLRMSATVNALRIVASMRCRLRLAVHDDRRAARGLDLLARGGAELVRVDGERLGELAAGEDLHGDVLARAQALGLQRLERDLGAGVEAALQVGEVDRLRVRPEGLEGHRHLL